MILSLCFWLSRFQGQWNLISLTNAMGMSGSGPIDCKNRNTKKVRIMQYFCPFVPQRDERQASCIFRWRKNWLLISVLGLWCCYGYFFILFLDLKWPSFPINKPSMRDGIETVSQFKSSWVAVCHIVKAKGHILVLLCEMCGGKHSVAVNNPSQGGEQYDIISTLFYPMKTVCAALLPPVYCWSSVMVMTRRQLLYLAAFVFSCCICPSFLPSSKTSNELVLQSPMHFLFHLVKKKKKSIEGTILSRVAVLQLKLSS